MPEGLSYRGATYVIKGKKYETSIGNTAQIEIPVMQVGETVDITIKAFVKNSEENKHQRTITNKVKLTAESGIELETNEISHTIVEKLEDTGDSTVTEPIEGTYKITGLAWLDEDKDGRRDETEKLLPNIEVILVNQETGKIVTDPVTGMNKIQKTNQNGVYTFSNLVPGKYIVVFLYDTANYDVTAYRKEGIIEDKNSDVISMGVTIKGETKLAGVANSIEILNNDITNIDMGLVIKQKFDLRLDKTVSKVTVNNSKGTKTYEFNDAKLAKVDLDAKTIEGSTLVIEYKIKVTNEGEVPGYVKKIIDYMPKDMKFNSELNIEWYEGERGNLYCSSLADVLLQPGETKEVTLILTKVMTNDNTGTINNVAEIYEASNDYGIIDVDSTPANKVQNEDDISLADVIIGVKTGEIYVYIVITLVSIAMLGIGIYFINKKVLRKI